MADIDFDELDRAVTTHLKKGPKKAARRKPAKQAAAPPATPLESPQPSSMKPVVQVPPIPTSPPETSISATPQPPVKVTAPSHQPIVRPHRGRFMDMVGSTNKPTGSSQTPGATLAPVTQTHQPVVLDLVKPVVQPPHSINRPTVPVIKPQSPSLPSEPTVVPPDHRLAADDEGFTKPVAKPSSSVTTRLNILWPSKKPEPEPEVEPEAEPTTDETPPVQPSASLLDLTSQTTPFLEGTKVSKRPLNQLGEDTDGYDDTFTDHQPKSDVASGPLSERTRPNAVLPRELQDDVIRAERGEGTSERSAGRSPFATKVDTPDDDDHPLFDETTYHEPIIAVDGRRKVPTWLKWLSGVVLCLLAGAGAGYALFTFGL